MGRLGRWTTRQLLAQDLRSLNSSTQRDYSFDRLDCIVTIVFLLALGQLLIRHQYGRFFLFVISFRPIFPAFFYPALRPEFVIVPWTRLSARQLQREIKKGIKLTVQCQDDEIDLFVDDQQVAHVRDAAYDSGYIGLISIRTDRVIFRDLNVEGTP